MDDEEQRKIYWECVEESRPEEEEEEEQIDNEMEEF
jgi:hypothetical protein